MTTADTEQVEVKEKPKRIQRKRTKGWRMPAGVVYVGRPGTWRNPFRVGINGVTLESCLSMFRTYAVSRLRDEPQWLDFLRGKDLACWCKEPKSGEPDLCHAAILLELANQ